MNALPVSKCVSLLDRKRLMADTDRGKQQTSDKEVRIKKDEKEEEILVVDMNDDPDVVLSGGGKTKSKSRVISYGSKVVGSPKGSKDII